MQVLTGAFGILAAVIVAGGVAKLASPGAFAATLRSMGLPGGTVAARLSGALEVVVGVAAILLGGSAAALVVAAAYAGFAVTIVFARRAGSTSCGCFGAAAAPPGTLHVAVNATSALVALAAAFVDPAGLPEVLAEQPLAGLPYLVSLATGAWLIVVLDTTGARLIDEMAAVRRLAPTFRDNARAATVPSRTVTRPRRARQD